MNNNAHISLCFLNSFQYYWGILPRYRLSCYQIAPPFTCVTNVLSNTESSYCHSVQGCSCTVPFISTGHSQGPWSVTSISWDTFVPACSKTKNSGYDTTLWYSILLIFIFIERVHTDNLLKSSVLIKLSILKCISRFGQMLYSCNLWPLFNLWWFYYSVITFSYTKCFVHSYTVYVIFTLSYLNNHYDEQDPVLHGNEIFPQLVTDIAYIKEMKLLRPTMMTTPLSLKV